ncbi:MAG: AAA family ATPase [Candidatus Dependentiae bacterium]|nr:AAA family ATPase [Candidatus Dependentiae bacterium]
MTKNLYACFLATFILSTNSILPAEPQKDMAYNMSQSAVRGAMEEISRQLNNSSPETTKKIIRDLLAGGFSAISDALKGKELKELNKNAIPAISEAMATISKGIQSGTDESVKILNKTMADGSKEFGIGLNDVATNTGKQMQETFKEGGDLDKGISQGVSIYTRNINRGIQSLVHNNMMKAGGIAVATSTTLFIAQYGIPLAFRMIERALLKPKLIISSSKKSLYQKLFGPKAQETPMIFTPWLQDRLDNIIKVTSTISKKIKEGKSNVKYRNLLLYGAPGTGKTLFATELAKRSGLEYACMSGSSFSKFKDGEGIEALDELFAWANKSKNGLLIFIDEAETFLSKRENMDPQSKSYLLLNNFLNYTGTRSNKFMIVFATNHKDVLDSAMDRRIDDLIEMPLPGLEERVRILNLYKDIILMDLKQNEPCFVQSVSSVLTQRTIEEMAIKTQGLSGGDLEGIINTIKTDADILDPAIVTHHLINTVIEQAMAKHKAFSKNRMSYLASTKNG